MILVADSGATKTDWCLIDKKGERRDFTTIGLNPTYLVDGSVLDGEIACLAEDMRCADKVRKVYFYGAGCSDEENRQKIAKSIARHFVNAKTEVFTDLLGACCACCGEADGIVGILGTGSNSCVYQGGNIVQNIPSAGYMLGDEGSGTYIGKQLLKKYLTKRMPNDIEAEFRDFINNLSRNEILDIVYRQPSPNKFFASLTPFALDNTQSSFINTLVSDCLDDFYENQICIYDTELKDLYMVGSVASILEKQLRECAKKHGFVLRKVLQKPIEGLAEYHSKRD